MADEQTAKVDLGRQKLVMSAKMSSMGEMATGIAHEINNPLAIISAKSQSMVERISKPNPDLAT
ncbi:MAG TPA: hypothetical protein PLU50_11705, partial [Pseudobdellovibrionaceae bacterium]|nr:hypothetical protein [Pseudobdellovibrionaceae bacterium]